MEDFESKEFRSHAFPNKTQNNTQEVEFNIEVDVQNVQMAEVELDQDILLAVSRC